MTFAVVDAKRQGSAIILNVELKNDSPKAVNFLYSFLDIQDDQGRALSGITDGLPQLLPANGDNFSGTIKVPSVLLNGTKTVSLSLTDYPDQNLELSIGDIPVVN